MTIDIATKRIHQSVAIVRIQAASVSSEPTIEALCHRLDHLADPQVTNPHLAQRFVEFGEHVIEQRLSDSGGDIGLGPQPPHNHRRVQRNHVESTVGGIRYGKGLVEDGGSSLGDQFTIQLPRSRRGR